MDNRQQILTRTQCSAMRGIAIIGIFLHNYCHWLGMAVKENEYTFTAGNCRRLLEVMTQPDWNLPVHLLSFFGHYGVPVFLFLSAYGLVMKYENGGNDTITPQTEAPSRGPSAVAFIRYHFLKLFKMMIVGFVAFTMIDAITPGRWHYSAATIVAQIGMFNNLMPDPDHVIWPGPYWFFGLMLQLYVVYRLLLYRRGWKPLLVAVAACWLMQAICSPEGETLNRLRYNCIGGILPFALGLLFARHGRELKRGAWVGLTLASALAVFFFSFNYQLWFWAPLFVCTFTVGIVKLMPKSINDLMAWVGSISAALFVMHPITRKIFIPISRHGDIYAGLLLYIIASVAIAWLCRELMKKIPNPKM